MLNQILADSIVLYDLYKEYIHLAAGEQFRQLRVRLDAHSLEQLELIDRLVDGVERLGGVASTDPRQVANVTTVRLTPDLPPGAAATASRLRHVHETIIAKIRESAARLPQHSRADDQTLSDAVDLHLRHVRFVATIPSQPRPVICGCKKE